MEFEIIISPRFERSYKKFTKNNFSIIVKIDNAIKEISLNPYFNNVNSHKLSGNLSHLYSCKCGFDCRIIYEVLQNSEYSNQIILLDIGTQDEVY